METTESRQYKVIMVGAPKVGKTSLIQRYLFDDFHFDVPEISQEERKTVVVKNCRVNLVIYDMTDMASSEILTRCYYADTKAVIFVYDITRLETLFEAEPWIKDLRLYLHEELLNGLPVLFVGNKLDEVNRHNRFLMLEDEDNPQAEFVTLQQAKGYTQKEGFLLPLECSAKTGEGVANIFQRIASVLAGQNDKKLSWCNIF